MPFLRDVKTFGAGALASPWRNNSAAYYGGAGDITVNNAGVLALGTSAASGVDTSVGHEMAVGDSFVVGPIVAPTGADLIIGLYTAGGGPLYRVSILRNGDNWLAVYNSEAGASSGGRGYDPALHRYFRFKLVADGGASLQEWVVQVAAADPHLEGSWTTLMSTTTGNRILTALQPLILFTPGTATTSATVDDVNPDPPPSTPAATDLRFTTQPANQALGQVSLARVTATDAAGTSPATASGNVTLGLHPDDVAAGAIIRSASGLTKALADVGGGVMRAEWNDIKVYPEDVGYQLVATHATLTGATSSTFDVTAPTGGGTTILLGGKRMEKPMAAAGSAKERTLYFWLRDAAGALLGAVTGAAQLSKNGAAAAASTNAIAAAGPAGRYKLELTAAELAAQGDHVEIVPWGTAAFVEGEVAAVVTAYNPLAATDSKADIAAEVAAHGDVQAIKNDSAAAKADAAAAKTAAQAVDGRLTAPRATALDSIPTIASDAAQAVGQSTIAAAEATSADGKLDNLNVNVDLTGVNTKLDALAEESNQSVEFERATGSATGYLYLLDTANVRTGKRRTITFASPTSGVILKISRPATY